MLASITTEAKQHLSACLGEEVSTLVYNRYGKTGYEGLDEAGLLEAARVLVVKTRNKLVTNYNYRRCLRARRSQYRRSWVELNQLQGIVGSK